MNLILFFDNSHRQNFAKYVSVRIPQAKIFEKYYLIGYRFSDNVYCFEIIKGNEPAFLNS